MSRPLVFALLMNDAGLGDYYQGELRRGAERVCRERDVRLWVYGGRLDWTASGNAQRQIFDLVHPDRVDGIVVAAGCISSFSSLDDVLVRLRERCPVPMCAIGECSPGVPSLAIDNATGSSRLVEHLVRAHGRRQFAYIGGPLGHQESDQRLSGTRQALARLGLSLRPEAVRHGNFVRLTGREIVEDWLAAGIPFDAIIAANDDMAVGALEALHALGLRCPDDVAVAGFDDSVTARFSQPALTTVRQPVAALGAGGIETLLRICEGREAAALIELDTDLVLRESCGCQAGSQIQLMSAEATPNGSGAQLVDLLTPVLDSREQRVRWAVALQAGVAAEGAGEAGALPKAVGALLEELTLPHVHVDELQRSLTLLRARAQATGTGAALEEAFHAARLLVSSHAARISGERNLRASWLLRELRRGSERLAAALSLSVLRDALNMQLPELGVRNALIALYTSSSLERLEAFVYLQDGRAVSLPPGDYATELLLPDAALQLSELPSLTILPLTFQFEQLGVIALEIPMRLELYAMLREQIGGAIKTAQLHQEVLAEQRLYAQAQEEKRATTERIKSLSLIAGGVAHDLNNVLGPLLALPEVIQKELESSPNHPVPVEVVSDLASIQDAGQRAAYTIRDLLALARVDAAPKTLIDLTLILRGEQRAFADLCRQSPQIAVRVELGPGPLGVYASESHLLRAVSNLVINALDAIDGPGTITVRAFERRVEQRIEGVDPIEAGHYAVVEVSDTGRGIPPESRARIFEPFFSAKRRVGTPGTGLGLSIVQRIVKDCSGYIHLQSEAERGTTFTLYFPLHEGGVLAPLAPRQVAPSRGTERILVVDDESLQLRVARRILSTLGYSVVTAPTGDQALELYAEREQRDGFDLVIVDMMMPGRLNGVATIEEMRRIRPAQKALVATGFSPERMDILAGARGLPWLAKPYTLNALSEAVRAVLDRAS